MAVSEVGQKKHQFLVQDQHPIDVTFCGPGMDIRDRITHGMREARLQRANHSVECGDSRRTQITVTGAPDD